MSSGDPSPRGTVPVWAVPAPGSRRPRFTREQIAQAALAIADAEGIEALSMRRLADELGAGTMTLYHYLPSKRDLLALMDDAIYLELLVPDDERATSWRDALAQHARRMRAAWERRPWVINAPQAQLGPNGMRFFEQALAGLADMPLEAPEKMELIAFVHDYVLGFALHASMVAEVSDDVRAEVAAYMARQLAEGEFPHIEELVGDDVHAFIRQLDAATTADERFERGLHRLLDGVAVELEARSDHVG